MNSPLWKASAFVAAYGLLGGCGGRTEPDAADASLPESDSKQTAPAKSEPPPNKAADKGKFPSGTTRLGECEPGFSQAKEPGASCPWTHEGLCYETKLAACACACPRGSTNSTCISGFEDPVNPVAVSCF